MSSTLCNVTFCSSSSSPPLKMTKTPFFSISCYQCYSPRIKTLQLSIYSSLSQLGLSQITPWNGLRHLGISISTQKIKDGRKAKNRGKGVYASLFGVGAPEALVIGVVALLVFGPKGLAEVARNLGKTLRAFQPTIRELQDVSKEFKSTLEREIGLDDDPRSMRDPYESNFPKSTPSSSVVEDFQTNPNGTPSSNAYSTEDYLRITEEQLKASAAIQQDGKPSLQESQIETVSELQSQPTVASSPPEGPFEPESQPQDLPPSPPENSVKSESRSEAAVQETTSIPSSAES